MVSIAMKVKLCEFHPLTDIRELIAASSEIEKSEEENHLPERRWIEQLVHPGSSLGGARPKASAYTLHQL